MTTSPAMLHGKRYSLVSDFESRCARRFRFCACHTKNCTRTKIQRPPGSISLVPFPSRERERNEIYCTTFLFIYPNTHLQTLHKRLYCCSPTPFPSFCLSRFKILAHERRAPPHHVCRHFWVKSFVFVCGLSKYTCGDTLSHMQILVCVYINQYRCHCTVALNAMMLLYIWPSHTYYIHHMLVGTRVRTYHNERLTRVIVLPAASLYLLRESLCGAVSRPSQKWRS
jgi:hypothetical protein